jgi:hypothetical protein
VIAKCSLFEEVTTMATPSMQESLVGGSSQLSAMEVELAKPPRNGRFVVPCEEGGCTAYKSQRSGITQQEGSVSEANPVGFIEGSANPSYCQEVYCQRDE